MSAPRSGRTTRRGSNSFASQPSSRVPNGPSLASTSRPQRGRLQSRASTRPSTQAYKPPHRASNAHTTSTRGRGQGQLSRRATDSNQSWRRTENAGNADYKQRIEELFQQLRVDREKERADAIRNGLLADPNKRTRLEDAITVVGTCEDMCPQFERIQRIREAAVEAPEKITISSGSKVPSEDLMVKCFHRSDAGKDEQLPSDLRPPKILQKTLDYLFDDILSGSEPLASVHKFLWDRTRAIRNDFSIQQVTKPEDLRIAIECFERIARFHLLSLHQLTHPTRNNGDFVPQQEREQLSNTLVSLMYYYDDSRSKFNSPNEAEFRAYSIILEIRARSHDLQSRIQDLPRDIVLDPKVQTAMRLHAASGKIRNVHNVLSPLNRTFAVGKGDYANFWSIVRLGSVTYLMACAAEVAFNFVRARALETMEKAFKAGTSRPKLEDFTLDNLVETLGYDDDDQTQDFLEDVGISFKERSDGDLFLDVESIGSIPIDTISRHEQIFSQKLVETKRRHRALKAVAKGLSVQESKAEGLIDDESDAGSEESLFVSSPASPERDASPPPAKVAREAKPLTSSNPFPNPNSAATDPFAAAKNNAAQGLFRKPSVEPGFGSASGSAVPSSLGGMGSASFQAPQQSNQEIAQSVFGGGTSLNKQESKTSDPRLSRNNSLADAIPAPSPFANSQPTQGSFSSFSTSSSKGFEFGKSTAAESAEPKSSFRSGDQPRKSLFDRIEQPSSQFGAEPALKISEQKPAFSLHQDAKSTPSASLGPFSVSSANPTAPVSNPAQQSSFPAFGAEYSTSSTSQPFKNPFSNLPASPFASSGIGTGGFNASAKSPFKTTDDQNSPFKPPKKQDQELEQPKNAGLDFGSFLGSAWSQAPQASFFSSSPHTSGQNATASSSSPPASSKSIASDNGSKRPEAPSSFINSASTQQKSAFPSSSSSIEIAAKSETFPLTTSTKPALLSSSAVFSADAAKPSLQQFTSPFVATSTSATPRGKVVEAEQRHDHAAEVRSKTLDRLAKDLVCGDYGLVEQMVEHLMEYIFEDSVKTLKKERKRERKAELRRVYLSKKYLPLWREKAWKLRLKRKALFRRQTLARSVRELASDANQSQKSPHQSPNSAASQKQVNGAIPLGSLLSAPHHFHTGKTTQPSSGKKRKDLHEDGTRTREGAVNGTSLETEPITPKRHKFAHHKRSKTVAMSLPNFSNAQAVNPSDRLRASLSNKRNRLSHSDSLMSESVLKRARHILGKTDTTRTDYFRLKAMGVDPNTPLVPNTLRRSRASLASSMGSGASSSSSLNNNSAQTQMPKPPPQNIASLSLSAQTRELIASRSQSSSASPNNDNVALTSTPKLDNEEEDLFAQARQLREALAEDEAWFRREREAFEEREKSKRPPEGETEKQRRLREWEATPSKTSLRLERTNASGFLPPDWKERTKGKDEVEETEEVDGFRSEAGWKGKGKARELLGKEGMPNGTSSREKQTAPLPSSQQQQRPRGLAALTNGTAGRSETAFRRGSALAAKGSSADDAIEL